MRHARESIYILIVLINRQKWTPCRGKHLFLVPVHFTGLFFMHDMRYYDIRRTMITLLMLTNSSKNTSILQHESRVPHRWSMRMCHTVGKNMAVLDPGMSMADLPSVGWSLYTSVVGLAYAIKKPILFSTEQAIAKSIRFRTLSNYKEGKYWTYVLYAFSKIMLCVSWYKVDQLITTTVSITAGPLILNYVFWCSW